MSHKDKEIRRYLNVIKRAVTYIEGMLDADDGGLLEQMMAPPQPVPQPVVQVPPLNIHTPAHDTKIDLPVLQVAPIEPPPDKNHEIARKNHVADLLSIDCWPEAVLQSIADKPPTRQDQTHRAKAVLDSMLDRTVEGLKFLDYGCGEGWVVQEICSRGVAEAWGFDPEPSESWGELGKVSMTNYREKLPTGNYFDIIMLHDVLDHCKDPVEVMGHVRSLLKHGGTVYVKCHPWTSKHATHAFKQGLNKAYIHLFLNWDEIKAATGQEPKFTRPEKNAVEAYHWWFKAFDIKRERFIREPVSDFFQVPAFKELLANEQQIPLAGIDDFLKLMEIQFVNYVLTPKK